MAIRSTMGISATLSTTPQSVYSLLAAVDPNAPRNVRKLRITADVGNADTTLFGDASITNIRFSDALRPTSVDKVEENAENKNSISVTNKYLRGLAATPTVHIYVDVF